MATENPAPQFFQSKKRFWLYGLIAFVFGVLDWFYLNWFPETVGNLFGESIIVVPIVILLNYGIWLVPIIPLVFLESKYSPNIRIPIITGALTWCFAIIGYYFYYLILLSMGKLPHLQGLSIFGEKHESFWVEYWEMFCRIILSQILDWIPIAIIGGIVISAIVYWIVKNTKKNS